MEIRCQFHSLHSRRVRRKERSLAAPLMHRISGNDRTELGDRSSSTYHSDRTAICATERLAIPEAERQSSSRETCQREFQNR